MPLLPAHRTRTLFAVVVLLSVTLLSVTGCKTREVSADRLQPEFIDVQVARPKHVRIPAEIDVSGTVETPSEPTNVAFLVSGKVIRAGPREGDSVKAGEMLAMIDPADFHFAVKSAAAQTALARAQFEKASVSARPEVLEAEGSSCCDRSSRIQGIAQPALIGKRTSKPVRPGSESKFSPPRDLQVPSPR